jgi:hypothetical protein
MADEMIAMPDMTRRSEALASVMGWHILLGSTILRMEDRSKGWRGTDVREEAGRSTRA